VRGVKLPSIHDCTRGVVGSSFLFLGARGGEETQKMSAGFIYYKGKIRGITLSHKKSKEIYFKEKGK